MHCWVSVVCETVRMTVCGVDRCFCEVYIDDSPAARTTAKQNDGMLFWGEVFELKYVLDKNFNLNMSIECPSHWKILLIFLVCLV